MKCKADAGAGAGTDVRHEADAEADASVLVIGEPECDPNYYPPLVGAQQEACAVRDTLVSAGGLREEQVLALTSKGDRKPNGPNARTVINALMQSDWRIVHIAGHGMFDQRAGDAESRSGVVLSDGLLITAAEIDAIRPDGREHRVDQRGQ